MLYERILNLEWEYMWRFFYNLKVHERSAFSFQIGIQKDKGLDIEKETPRITLCKVPHKTRSLPEGKQKMSFLCC